MFARELYNDIIVDGKKIKNVMSNIFILKYNKKHVMYNIYSKLEWITWCRPVRRTHEICARTYPAQKTLRK